MKDSEEEDCQQCSGLEELVKGEESRNKAIELGKIAVSHLFTVQFWSVSLKAKPRFRKFVWKALV